ncbi:MAG: thermonuclease family protein [Myxococcales bacterium]|nr:MAG: thermonuclease family protein [Myxococcales bacterium]
MNVPVLSYLLVLGLLGACSSGASQSGEGSVIEGTAVVVDGDGVEIDGRKIRLFGIDAPETGQYCERDDGVRWRCGQYSTVELDRLAGGRRLSCEVKDVDPYDRPVAVCRAGDRDIAAEQVRGGWAVAYRRYSERYIELEDEARRARRGVWQGSFEKPWDWRRRMREN